MVGRICWFSSKSGLIYTTLEMLMHACMRDEVVWFALMPVRGEQQPASSGVRCCFSSLVNTLCSLPPLLTLFSPVFPPSLPLTLTDTSGRGYENVFYLPFLSFALSCLLFCFFVLFCFSCQFYFSISCRMGDKKLLSGQNRSIFRKTAVT